MNAKKKLIIISILIGAFGALSYFAYSVVSNRYFSEPPKIEEASHPITFYDINKVPENQEIPVDENPTVPGEENSAPPKDGKKNIQANITRQNCDEGCKSFSEDQSLRTYCEKVCGLSPVENVSECDSKTGLEKDYCQKDLAISKTDSALCESIADDNIRKTCKNRIAEDLLEKVQAGNDEALK